jgi:integrase
LRKHLPPQSFFQKCQVSQYLRALSGVAGLVPDFPPIVYLGTTFWDHVDPMMQGGDPVMRARISKRTVDNLKPGDQLFDIEARGFTARCLPSGAISYDLRYRTATGERRRLSLGLHGKVTPDQARTIAEKRLDDLAKDRDPAIERQRLRGTTVNAVLDNYVERVLGSKRSRNTQASAFDRLVRPAIGQRSLYDVTRADMASMFDSIEDSSGPVMADRTLAYVRTAFNWQQARDQNFVSPIVKGMTRTSAKERARKRTLTDDELRAVWKATAGEGAFDRLVRFLLLTGARRTEASAMTWSELHGANWLLPAARNKTKVSLLRPLSRAAQATLPEKRGTYVFTTDKGKTSFSGYSKAKAKLDLESGVADWTPHDLRRTARTLMARAGVSREIAEICLGHTQPVIVETYDQYQYDDEKREAFEKLAALVRTIVEANP